MMLFWSAGRLVVAARLIFSAFCVASTAALAAVIAAWWLLTLTKPGRAATVKVDGCSMVVA
jgi:hypothetical protein